MSKNSSWHKHGSRHLHGQWSSHGRICTETAEGPTAMKRPKMPCRDQHTPSRDKTMYTLSYNTKCAAIIVDSHKSHKSQLPRGNIRFHKLVSSNERR